MGRITHFYELTLYGSPSACVSYLRLVKSGRSTPHVRENDSTSKTSPSDAPLRIPIGSVFSSTIAVPKHPANLHTHELARSQRRSVFGTSKLSLIKASRLHFFVTPNYLLLPNGNTRTIIRQSRVSRFCCDFAKS